MFRIRLAQSLAVIGVRTLVYPHKLLYSLIFVAEKLSSADMNDAMARMAYGDYVFEFLYGVFFVVTPPFVRLEPLCRSAADHTPPAGARVCVFADYITRFPRQFAPKIGIPASVGYEFKIEFIAHTSSPVGNGPIRIDGNGSVFADGKYDARAHVGIVNRIRTGGGVERNINFTVRA